MTVLRWLLVTVGVLAIAFTVLPLIRSKAAWIRIWDFPRLQIATVLAAVLLTAPFLMALNHRAAAFLALTAAALAWQLYGIRPYTRLAATQVVAASDCGAGSTLRLLVANVLIDNRDVMPLLRLVGEVDPDVLLLVETDAWWDGRLEPLHKTHPFVIAHPQENSYGMHLFSRFELIDPQVRFLAKDTIPSVRTGLRLPSGARIEFYGVHQEPPPLEDTEERDAELLIVGKEIRKRAAPSIVAGDLNDVAWSRTNALFQEISGMLDPRIGRGLYATFDANWPLLRWPLDHIFFEDAFKLLDLAVLRDIGSDHFPLFVALCHEPAAAAVQKKPQPEHSDVEEAEEAIEQGREKKKD